MTTCAEPLLGRPALDRSGIRGRAARFVVERLLESMPVRARYPDGRVVGGSGLDDPTIDLVRPAALFARLGRNPKIGLGEAYVAGDWTAAEGTDLCELLTPFAARLSALVPSPLMRLRVLLDRRIPRSQRNTPDGARRNIGAHYDLNNDLFELFLDPSMTYSSALFDDSAPLADQDLHTAQLRKINRVLDLAGVTASSRVLEIGTGWGSLAVEAARRGAQVTTVTISKEQLALSRQRVERAGLASRVDLRPQDYREVRGSFDAIVSVEMIEAVGEEFWPTYFATLDRLLAPGGRVALQSIVMEHDRFLATRHSFGWIQKYIFPGGLIPSIQAIEEAVGRHTRLEVTGRQAFGAHYAETLRRWRRAFDDRWPTIRSLGFDQTFRRMWQFYLAYCEAGFATGYLDVLQLQLTRRGDA